MATGRRPERPLKSKRVAENERATSTLAHPDGLFRLRLNRLSSYDFVSEGDVCADVGSQVTLFHRISRQTIVRMLLIMAVALSVGTFFKLRGPQNEQAFIQNRQFRLQT